MGTGYAKKIYKSLLSKLKIKISIHVKMGASKLN